MVSKKTAASSVSDIKSDSSVTEPKKKTSSSKSKIAAPKSTTKKEVAKKVVPETHNVDVVGEVLNVKSRNDAKKSSHASKNVKVNAETPAIAEKSSKTVLANAKRSSVKENAKIAEAKKFAEMKEHPADVDVINETCGQDCCGGAWCAWIHAYKNIFNFKGRTSRFEFWSFMLINIFALLLVSLGIETLAPSTIALVLTVLIYLVEIVVYLSIFVRRLHDAGYSAWKGFFRPLLISWVLTGIVSFYGIMYPQSHPENVKTFISIASLAVVLLLVYGYYGIKTFIAAGFFEEEHNANVYGAASFIDDAHKMKSLRYAAIYLLIIILGYLISLSSIFYSALEALYSY